MDTATVRPAHSIPAAYLDAFERHLRAENKAPETTTTDRKACDQLAAFLDSRGMPPLASPRREHIEAFLVNLQEHGAAAATVAQRYRSIQQLFRWLADEGEVHDSPMARMKVPAVPLVPPPMLGEGDLMHLMGHRSTALIHSLYGASAAVGRPRIAYRKHSPGDRL
jgi:site-specific recombinase XerD